VCILALLKERIVGISMGVTDLKDGGGETGMKNLLATAITWGKEDLHMSY
jgi:hypothetical protein